MNPVLVKTLCKVGKIVLRTSAYALPLIVKVVDAKDADKLLDAKVAKKVSEALHRD